MERHRNVCGGTINNKSNRKHLRSSTHSEPENSLRIKHTIQNPNFFDIHSILDEHITSHNTKFVK